MTINIKSARASLSNRIHISSDKESNTFENIQILRGVAALVVVAHHAFIMLHERGIDTTHDWVGGGAGVDIFFSISGFLMVWTTSKSWGIAGANRYFLLKRLVRIAPMYWILTLAKVVLILIVPSLALRSALEPWHTAASFLFLPATNTTAGHSSPVLPVGWTLNLEMFFYVLFAAALLVGKNPVRWLMPVLVAIGLIGIAVFRPGEPALFYLDPIILEFAMGVAVAWMVKRRLLLPPAIAWLATFIALLAMISAEYIPGFAPSWRVYVWGIPGALLLLAMVSLEGRLSQLPGYRIALHLGDASYSIYLSHAFVLTAIGIACSRLGYSGLGASVVVIALSLLLSALTGVALRHFLEAPLGSYLSRRLLPRTTLTEAPKPIPAVT